MNPAHLAGCALHPEFLKYVVFWTRPGRFGWEITIIYSTDTLEKVRECFHSEHFDQQPSIVSILCLPNN